MSDWRHFLFHIKEMKGSFQSHSSIVYFVSAEGLLYRATTVTWRRPKDGIAARANGFLTRSWRFYITSYTVLRKARSTVIAAGQAPPGEAGSSRF
ncbi:hypothetical protein [Novosphingobium cyanobacteriorum]|uniref:hypothetical protein n=1 Tax=Novosphingobium cyanobacteriorum TaxID=3024215 RepID=UPI0023F85E62|nr:hypothetical protein [Novosphingobium cyanobacteriorum]